MTARARAARVALIIGDVSWHRGMSIPRHDRHLTMGRNCKRNPSSRAALPRDEEVPAGRVDARGNVDSARWVRDSGRFLAATHDTQMKKPQGIRALRYQSPSEDAAMSNVF